MTHDVQPTGRSLLTLFTNRFQAFRHPQGVSVRITLGGVRFKLPYSLPPSLPPSLTRCGRACRVGTAFPSLSLNLRRHAGPTSTSSGPSGSPRDFGGLRRPRGITVSFCCASRTWRSRDCGAIDGCSSHRGRGEGAVSDGGDHYQQGIKKHLSGCRVNYTQGSTKYTQKVHCEYVLDMK